MKLDAILDEWEKDCEIPLSDLTNSSLETGKLHHKYYRLMCAEHVLQRRYEEDLKFLKAEKIDFLREGETHETRARGWEYPGGKVLKTDLPHYLDKDKDIIELTWKIVIQKEKVELLESIIRMINNRSYHIRNAIDHERFKAGG